MRRLLAMLAWILAWIWPPTQERHKKMGGSIAPVPFPSYLTNAGVLAASYKLFTYLPGTTTPVTTYTDEDLTSAHTNPIIVSSAGRTPSPIYLSPGVSVKFVFTTDTDTDPPTSPLWTADPVNPTEQTNLDVDITGIAGEAVNVNEVVYPSTGQGSDSARTAGRWYKADPTTLIRAVDANQLGFVLGGTYSAGDTISIRTVGRIPDIQGLTAGRLYYVDVLGGVTLTPPANPRPIGFSDSTGGLVIGPWVPITDASATHSGRITTAAQTIAGVKSFNDHLRFEPGTSSGTYANANGRLTTNVTNAGNTDTGEDNLMSYTLPAAVLDTDGKAVRVTAWFSTAANGNTKTVKFYFGAATATVFSAASNDQVCVATAYIVRTAATTQKILLYNQRGTGIDITDVVAGTESLSGTVVIKFTGEATATNDVVQEGMIVEVVG